MAVELKSQAQSFIPKMEIEFTAVKSIKVVKNWVMAKIISISH